MSTVDLEEVGSCTLLVTLTGMVAWPVHATRGMIQLPRQAILIYGGVE